VPVAIRHARLGMTWRSCRCSRTGLLRGTTTLSGLRPRRGASGCVCPGHCPPPVRRGRVRHDGPPLWRPAGLVDRPQQA
jgi:hypothetical protein